jgi:hypothetical protein
VSAGQFGEVDLDLLADYVGGALDGTAEEEAVARRIAEDPRWAQAYARLAQDSADVRLALASWRAEPVPMPPDVVERLSAGLAAAAKGGDRTAAPHVDGAADARGPSATRPPGRLAAGAARPAGRGARRRLPRWAAPVVVAAAVAAVAGLGSQLVGDIRGADDSTTFSRDAAQSEGAAGGPAMQPAPLAAPSPDQVFTTGTDYTRGSLVNQVIQLGSRAAALTRSGEAPPAVPDSAFGNATPDDSARRTAMTACLQAIADEHGRGMPRFDVVDYARFEGRPALIVAFTDSDGPRWVWAVAPECGQHQAGAAARYTARVG